MYRWPQFAKDRRDGIPRSIRRSPYNQRFDAICGINVSCLIVRLFKSLMQGSLPSHAKTFLVASERFDFHMSRVSLEVPRKDLGISCGDPVP